jgi:hypothetical protein
VPPGEIIPSEVIRPFVAPPRLVRYPQDEQFEAAVLGFGVDTRHWTFLVDESGSMVMETLQPGLDAFLAGHAGQSVQLALKGDELWLRWINEFLEQFIP